MRLHDWKITIALLGVATLPACVGVSPSTFLDLDPDLVIDDDDPDGADNATFATLLNNVRTANGAADVGFDARLASAAQTHADDMRSNDFFDHTGSDGSSVGDRATRAGYNWRRIGENIALGYADEESVMAGWTASPGHHANNIDPDFEDFGLAKAGSGGSTYWVLVLGAE